MRAALITELRRQNARRVADVDDRGELVLDGRELRFEGRKQELRLTIDDIRIVPTAFPWGRVPLVVVATLLMWAAIITALAIEGTFQWPPGTDEWFALGAAAGITLIALPVGIGVAYALTKARRRIVQVHGRSADGTQLVVNFSQGSLPGVSPELVHALERARVA